jgi:NAD(P)-dependent dehydrogenase (short-subunit alcohol dehydrogenase family)
MQMTVRAEHQTLTLSNKTAVITGAASGIGRAIAVRFAAAGARVVLADLDEERGHRVEEEIRAAGGDALFVKVDVSEPTQIERLEGVVSQNFADMSILCNCAAYFRPENFSPVAQTTLEEWNRSIAVNLTGAYLCCRAFIPNMVRVGGGSIIQIASIGALKPFPSCAPYVVSKAGLIGLTKSIARDYAADNVRANAICPGAIDTPGNEQFYTNREEFLELIRSTTPMGRIGRAEEVAAAALYLAGDESSYVSGSVLAIDGGRLLM